MDADLESKAADVTNWATVTVFLASR